jgi:hypothetical protein
MSQTPGKIPDESRSWKIVSIQVPMPVLEIRGENIHDSRPHEGSHIRKTNDTVGIVGGRKERSRCGRRSLLNFLPLTSFFSSGL